MPETLPPRSLCLLRLSALGDVTHVLPLLHTIRSAWPDAAITWVIGKGERRLLDGLPGVRFIEFDKRSGLGGMLDVRRQCGERFDALLQLQVSARANLLSAFIPAAGASATTARAPRTGMAVHHERIPDRGIACAGCDRQLLRAARLPPPRDLADAGACGGPRLGARAVAQDGRAR